MNIWDCYIKLYRNDDLYHHAIAVGENIKFAMNNLNLLSEIRDFINYANEVHIKNISISYDDSIIKLISNKLSMYIGKCNMPEFIKSKKE